MCVGGSRLWSVWLAGGSVVGLEWPGPGHSGGSQAAVAASSPET